MKNLIVLFFFSSIATVFGQNKMLFASKLNYIAIDADEFIGYDQFGFHYTIKNNVFTKTKDGESLDYKNIALGKITKVDIQ